MNISFFICTHFQMGHYYSCSLNSAGVVKLDPKSFSADLWLTTPTHLQAFNSQVLDQQKMPVQTEKRNSTRNGVSTSLFVLRRRLSGANQAFIFCSQIQLPCAITHLHLSRPTLSSGAASLHLSPEGNMPSNIIKLKSDDNKIETKVLELNNANIDQDQLINKLLLRY